VRAERVPGERDADYGVFGGAYRGANGVAYAPSTPLKPCATVNGQPAMAPRGRNRVCTQPRQHQGDATVEKSTNKRGFAIPKGVIKIREKLN
jgi:hypothetical protein